MLGVILPDDHSPSDNFEVWEENWEVLTLFLRLQTQWRIGMNGLTGLDYAATAWILKLYAEEQRHRELLEDLQIMEGAVLETIAKREA